MRMNVYHRSAQFLTYTSIPRHVQFVSRRALAPWAPDSVGTDTILTKSRYFGTFVDIYGENELLGSCFHWYKNDRKKRNTLNY